MFGSEKLKEIISHVDKSLVHINALTKGMVLNRSKYEIIKLEEISERAFVYKAKDLHSGKSVSIKEFFPKSALGLSDQLYFRRDFETGGVILEDPSEFKEKQFQNLIEGFIEEAQYLEKISYGDPLIRIIDAFKDYNTAYIVTNYNEWPSLQNIFDTDYQFTIDEFKWITEAIVDVLIRFHRRSIVHRNINARNIYIKPSELVVDSLGTCDFLQDIKIYDADAYNTKYYAPEVMIHGGNIGTWTDIYAIGKIMIDVLSRTVEKEDYKLGLDLLGEDSMIYEDVIRSAINFKCELRLQNAMEVKRILFKKSEDSHFKTPKYFIAMIAMITFVSSFMVLWQYQTDLQLAENDYIYIEDEPIPAGPLDMQEDVYFITQEGEDINKTMTLMWFRSGRCVMTTLEITALDTSSLYTVDLKEDQKSLDLSDLELVAGKYKVVLYYLMDLKPQSQELAIEIIE